MRMQRVIGWRANKVVNTGLLPAALYGVGVHGLDHVETMKVRRIAATAMRPGGKMRSLIAVHLIHNAPTLKWELAPAISYARAVWRGCVNREQASRKGMGLTDLRKMWEATAADRSRLEEKEGELGRGGGGNRQIKKKSNPWHKVKGPFGAITLTLRRIGWSFISAFKFKDDRGDEVTLAQSSPAAVIDLLVSLLGLGEEGMFQ